MLRFVCLLELFIYFVCLFTCLVCLFVVGRNIRKIYRPWFGSSQRRETEGRGPNTRGSFSHIIPGYTVDSRNTRGPSEYVRINRSHLHAFV